MACDVWNGVYMWNMATLNLTSHIGPWQPYLLRFILVNYLYIKLFSYQCLEHDICCIHRRRYQGGAYYILFTIDWYWTLDITQPSLTRHCILHDDKRKDVGQIWIYKRHPTPRPHGGAMGCILWETCGTASYRQFTVLRHSLRYRLWCGSLYISAVVYSILLA